MPISLPFIVFEKLESKLGKEDAHIVVEAIETTIRESIKSEQNELKYLIIDEQRKELASKADVLLTKQELKNEIELVKKEIDIVKKEIDIVKKEIDIFKRETRIMFLILFILIIFLNQNSLEFIFKIFGLIK